LINSIFINLNYANIYLKSLIKVTQQSAIQSEKNGHFVIWVYQQATAKDIPAVVFPRRVNGSIRQLKAMYLSGTTIQITMITSWHGKRIWIFTNTLAFRNPIRKANP
jgi:hypothetical protein